VQEPEFKCSFCKLDRKVSEVVRRLSPGLFICRDCVQLCAEILGANVAVGSGPTPN